MVRIAILLFALIAAGTTRVAAQARVEKNVIYGMYSGLALLMDIHYPEMSNGHGLIFIAGSGWQSRVTYGAPGLKEQQVGDWTPALLRAGYTVFALNHRAAPRFAYPAALEDVQRAVRFIRHHASRFGIHGEKLGGIGGSSGGHLVGLVGMKGSAGTPDDPDQVNRKPATLECVVLRAAPSDMSKMIGSGGIATAAVVSFLGRVPSPHAEDRDVYRDSSPILHVSASAPPTLLIHGDADDTVPYQQSVELEAALRGASAAVKLIRVPGGAHGSDFGTAGKPHPMFQEVIRETVSWLEKHLRGSSAAK